MSGVGMIGAHEARREIARGTPSVAPWQLSPKSGKRRSITLDSPSGATNWRRCTTARPVRPSTAAPSAHGVQYASARANTPTTVTTAKLLIDRIQGPVGASPGAVPIVQWRTKSLPHTLSVVEHWPDDEPPEHRP
jgi:hypothetical protein